jgi:hypothetical protein
MFRVEWRLWASLISLEKMYKKSVLAHNFSEVYFDR